MLKIRCRLLNYLLSKPESSHCLHRSGRRRIPGILIHDFAAEATRLVRDGLADTFPRMRWLQAMHFWVSPLGIGLRASLEPGLRPDFTLGRGIPDAGAGTVGASVVRQAGPAEEEGWRLWVAG